MMDPNILDLDFNILSQIEMILENRSTRETFLKAVPEEYFSYVSVQLMDNEAFRYHMTSARWLLFKLGSKGVRVSNVMSWLEKVNLQKALILLKRDVPLQITEQPPHVVKVQMGARLLMSCKASSYPPPEYQWFKGEEELLLQQDSELSIASAKEEDAGTYVCLISKRNVEMHDISWLYSNPVQVIVLEESFGSNSLVEFQTSLVPSDAILGPSSDQNREKPPTQIKTAYKGYTVPEKKITIVKQPYIAGKVPQGMSVVLHCRAESLWPIKYQWYKNGSMLKGETSRKLSLNDLVPDPDTGNTKWEYFCKVSNDKEFPDEEFSRTAIVELASADITTPYFPSEKYAFMIANDIYENLKELRKPAYDVADLGKALEYMKFKVFAYRNFTHIEIKNAFSRFCEVIKPNSYVLFYFAGHGFEQYGQMYIQPVDCSCYYRPEESICTEYILQHMQEAKPALNILLIDACRNLPPQFGDASNPPFPPGEIFEAKMKNNTLYGYSTPFLYSSHESDSERNSFFVKYLKKYITHNKSIQDILMQVQRDFQADQSIQGVQFPVIKSSLSCYRKLCDETDSSSNSRILRQEDIREDFVQREYEIPQVNSSILLETNSHMDIFLNGIDIAVSIDIKQNSPLSLGILQDLEVNLTTNMPEVRLLPLSGVHLKNLDLKIGIKNLLFKKQILGVQKIKDPTLTAKLFLKFSTLKIEKQMEVSINVKKITDMKLSISKLNYLGSREAETYSCENNNISFEKLS